MFSRQVLRSRAFSACVQAGSGKCCLARLRLHTTDQFLVVQASGYLCSSHSTDYILDIRLSHRVRESCTHSKVGSLLDSSTPPAGRRAEPSSLLHPTRKAATRAQMTVSSSEVQLWKRQIIPRLAKRVVQIPLHFLLFAGCLPSIHRRLMSDTCDKTTDAHTKPQLHVMLERSKQESVAGKVEASDLPLGGWGAARFPF